MERGVDYAGAVQAQINRTPELGRLKAASERVSIATQSIAAFVERFGGPHSAGIAGNAAAQPPPPPTYRNDINTLFDQIDLLETVASSLDDIG